MPIGIDGMDRLISAIENLSSEQSSPTPEKATETIIIEFSSDKPDEYFGIISSSNNYTLPEKQRVFSNSGWSIDDEGLYLNPSNATNRILLLSQQSLITELISIKYNLYIPGLDFIASVFSPVIPQTQNHYHYTAYVERNAIREYLNGTSNSYIINLVPSINFNLYNRIQIEFNFKEEKLLIYEANLDYLSFNLLGKFPLPIFYEGFVIPGFSGNSLNTNNRLKKIVIEREKLLI